MYTSIRNYGIKVMERKTRIHQIIEGELRKQLSFRFSMEENLSSPGSQVFARGDTVRFRAWVRNDSDLRFNRVAGLLSSTASSSFGARKFEAHDLEPRQERSLAVINAEILADPRENNGCGWIAKLTVVAAVDLPEIEICERERFIGHSSVATSGRHGPAGRPRSIPLSDAPL